MIPQVLHCPSCQGTDGARQGHAGQRDLRHRPRLARQPHHGDPRMKQSEACEQNCLELGAIDYIKKPIKKDIVLLRVKKALNM
jgi:hypothetical protein